MREEYGRKSRQSAGGGTRGSHSKRSIFRRTVFLMAVCGVLMFIPLFWKLWNIAIVNHDYYQQLATKQQTLDLSVSSSRDLRPKRQRAGHVSHSIQPDLIPQRPGKERVQKGLYR